MGDRTTRPHATLAACRIRRLVVVTLAVLAWLAGAPALAQTGPAQADRVIDGDAISVRRDGARVTVVNVHSSTPRRAPPRSLPPRPRHGTPWRPRPPTRPTSAAAGPSWPTAPGTGGRARSQRRLADEGWSVGAHGGLALVTFGAGVYAAARAVVLGAVGRTVEVVERAIRRGTGRIRIWRRRWRVTRRETTANAGVCVRRRCGQARWVRWRSGAE